jgi:hypothetical protein
MWGGVNTREKPPLKVAGRVDAAGQAPTIRAAGGTGPGAVREGDESLPYRGHVFGVKWPMAPDPDKDK